VKPIEFHPDAVQEANDGVDYYDEVLSLLNVRRGLCGAGIAAVVAAVLVVALPIGFMACGLDFPGATTANLGYDLREKPEQLIVPAIGSAAIFACAGWATFAPAGQYRFDRTLVIVFLAGLYVWVIGAVSDLAPRHYKGMSNREAYPLLTLYVLGPPLLTAALLTVARVYRLSKGRRPRTSSKSAT